MKKLLASILICLSIFVFTGCSSPMQSSTRIQNNLSCPFTSKMTVSLDKLTADGTITRLGEGQWEVEFETPNTLSGVNLSFDENIVNASYKGLKFSVPKSAIPVKSMLINLITAVDTSAREDELQGSESEGLLNISGSLEGGDYTLTVDGNGYIHTFEMPNNLLKISFSDVTVTDTPQPSEAAEATEATEESTDNATTVESQQE